MKGPEPNEKQLLIQCITRKLEAASLTRVREIFFFIQYTLR